MAVIRATCEECGDVELRTRDVLVRVPEGCPGGTYVFRCPCCGRPSVREAEPRVVEVLAHAGVRVQRWRPPAELAERRPGGAPFSLDDLLDFHELLQDDARLHLTLGRLTAR